MEELEQHLARTNEQQKDVADLRQRLAIAIAEKDSSAEREERVQLAVLRAQLTDAVAQHERLQRLLAESETQQMRTTAQFTGERMRAERSLGQAILAREEAAKALADERVEVQHLIEHARALELQAAAGRIARDVSVELLAIVRGTRGPRQIAARLVFPRSALSP